MDIDCEPISVHVNLAKLMSEENNENEFENQQMKYYTYDITQSSDQSSKYFPEHLSSNLQNSQSQLFQTEPVVYSGTLSNTNPHRYSKEKGGALLNGNGSYTYSNQDNHKNQNINKNEKNERKKSYQNEDNNYLRENYAVSFILTSLILVLDLFIESPT